MGRFLSTSIGSNGYMISSHGSPQVTSDSESFGPQHIPASCWQEMKDASTTPHNTPVVAAPTVHSFIPSSAKREVCDRHVLEKADPLQVSTLLRELPVSRSTEEARESQRKAGWIGALK